MSERTPHPHFNDHGTLDWKTTWEAAFKEAREAKKGVFIEFGREL